MKTSYKMRKLEKSTASRPTSSLEGFPVDSRLRRFLTPRLTRVRSSSWSSGKTQTSQTSCRRGKPTSGFRKWSFSSTRLGWSGGRRRKRSAEQRPRTRTGPPPPSCARILTSCHCCHVKLRWDDTSHLHL